MFKSDFSTTQTQFNLFWYIMWSTYNISNVYRKLSHIFNTIYYCKYIYICLSYSEHTYIITDTCKTTDRLWQQPQKKKYWHKCRPVDQ